MLLLQKENSPEVMQSAGFGSITVEKKFFYLRRTTASFKEPSPCVRVFLESKKEKKKRKRHNLCYLFPKFKKKKKKGQLDFIFVSTDIML